MDKAVDADSSTVCPVVDGDVTDADPVLDEAVDADSTTAFPVIDIVDVDAESVVVDTADTALVVFNSDSVVSNFDSVDSANSLFVDSPDPLSVDSFDPRVVDSLSVIKNDGFRKSYRIDPLVVQRKRRCSGPVAVPGHLRMAWYP